MGVFETYQRWLQEGGPAYAAERGGADAFLVRPVGDPAAAVQKLSFRTVVEPGATPPKAIDDPALRYLPLEQRFVLHPLAKTARNPFVDQITIGRTTNNDVVLHLPSVSKFHAWFSRGSGGYLLHDANSTFGTFAAGRKVLPDMASGVPVGPNEEIVFGEIRVLFLDTSALAMWLKKQSG
jgi:hypothetical protein